MTVIGTTAAAAIAQKSAAVTTSTVPGNVVRQVDAPTRDDIDLRWLQLAKLRELIGEAMAGIRTCSTLSARGRFPCVRLLSVATTALRHALAAVDREIEALAPASPVSAGKSPNAKPKANTPKA